MSTKSYETKARETRFTEDKLPARLLAVDEVAYLLGVHSSTIRRWERTGLLKSHLIGPRNNLRFRQEEILSFIEKTVRRREVV